MGHIKPQIRGPVDNLSTREIHVVIECLKATTGVSLELAIRAGLSGRTGPTLGQGYSQAESSLA